MKAQYILAALDTFSCIADKCPEDCCHRFAIFLDQPIFKKWHALPESDTRKDWLLAAVYCGVGDHDMQLAKVDGRSEASCVLRLADGLCRVHGELGVEYLPAICKSFPRITENLPGRNISFATMSCPEIARLVLLDDSLPVFRYEAATGHRRATGKQSVNELVTMFLYQHIRQLFSLQDFALNLRLTYLARLLSEVVGLLQKGQLSQRVLADLSAACGENLKRLAMAVRMGKSVTRPAQGRLMWEQFREGLVRFQLFQASGLAPDMRIVQLAERAETDEEAKTQFYQELMVLRDASRPALLEYNKIFVRYLEGRFMLAGFPFKQDVHPVESFLAAVFPFVMVQMMLWIKGAVVQHITPQDIVEAVVLVEKEVGHLWQIGPPLKQNPALREIQHYFDWFLEVC